MEENKTHYVRIAQACYPAEDWPEDTILYVGEVGWESDTGKFKVGNGSSTWSELEYWQQTEISEKLIATQEWVNQHYLVNTALEGYITESALNDKNYANKTEIPIKISQLVNDSGYLTDKDGVTQAQFSSEVQNYLDSNSYATQTWVNNQKFLTQVPSEYAKTSDVQAKITGTPGYFVVIGEGGTPIATEITINQSY